MKIKNILQFSLIAAVACLLGSCNNFLDTMPDNRAELDTPEKIRKLLVSAYPDRSYAIIAEAASDNFDDMGPLNPNSSPTFLGEAVYWEDINQAETDSNVNTWQQYYRAINHANTALEAIEKLGTPDELLPSKGEALLCRAYAHFCLTLLYCLPYHPEYSVQYLGIPYMESPATEISAVYSRGTLQGVYEKINRDVEEGLPLIRDEAYSVPKYHFNRSAAYAFAARFNLYYMNWEKTVEYAGKVLGTNPSIVLRDWEAVTRLPWGNGRARDYWDASHKFNLMMIPLWGVTPLIFNAWNGFGARYTHCNRVSKCETFRAKRPMGGTFDKGSNDTQTNVYIHPPFLWYSNDHNKIFMPKWSQEWEVTDAVTGAGGYRSLFVAFTTNETLMCRAEAYIHLKEYDKAVADLETWNQSFYKVGQNNVVSLTRERINEVYGNPSSPAYIAEYTSEAPTSRKKLNPHGFEIEQGEQENMIQCLLYCRRIETLADGLRWGDVKRYGIVVDRFDNSDYNDGNTSGFKVAATLGEKDLRRALQLPQEVISSGLAPNPRNGNAASHPFLQ